MTDWGGRNGRNGCAQARKNAEGRKAAQMAVHGAQPCQFCRLFEAVLPVCGGGGRGYARAGDHGMGDQPDRGSRRGVRDAGGVLEAGCGAGI